MKENNELIAEFMGVAKLPDVTGFLWDTSQTGKLIYGLRSEHLRYNENWTWLMPVVEKIAKIETDDVIYNGEDSYFDSYFPRTFGMINSETKEFMVRINRNPLHQSASLIDATYAAVVDFIQWYNTKQPKPEQ